MPTSFWGKYSVVSFAQQFSPRGKDKPNKTQNKIANLYITGRKQNWIEPRTDIH